MNIRLKIILTSIPMKTGIFTAKKTACAVN
jgi:hypothetical protein